MYNKTIIEFGFRGIQDNQGLGKCNQPRPYLDLDYSGYHKNLIQLLLIIDIVIYIAGVSPATAGPFIGIHRSLDI